MTTTSGTTIDNTTERVVAHVRDAAFDAFTATHLARAKDRLIDSLGCMAAGVRGEAVAPLARVVRGWAAQGRSSVLGFGDRTAAHEAAFVNAVSMRSFDFEAIGAEGANKTQTAAHLSGTTVPVALAIGQERGASGRDVLTALLVGDDLASRLARASGFDVYSGSDNTGTVNAYGGVAIAAKLRGLDDVQLQGAFGIVQNQLAGTVANIFDQSLAFKLPMAFAARNSIVATELATAGFTGPLDPIAGRFGFFDQTCADPKPERLTDALGEAYYADVVIKPWSSCRASHPSLDACVRVREAHGLRAADIERVRIHVTPRTKAGFVGAPFSVGQSPEVSGLFSIPFTAACALVHGTVRPEHLTLESYADPEIRRMLDRIELVDSLDNSEYLTAEVEVDTTTGETHRERVDVPGGDIYFTPLSRDALLDKYFRNVEFGGVASRAEAERAVELVDRFEELESLDELLACFDPA